MNLVNEAPVTAAQIPVFAVRDETAAGTTARDIGRVLDACGLTVGIATRAGTRVGGHWTTRDGGAASARAMLTDPLVEAAIVEGVSANVIVGIAPPDVFVFDRTGDAGADDVEAVAAVVDQRVQPGGTLVLRADDARLMTLVSRWKAERPPRRIVLFANDGALEIVRRHVEEGGTAYVVEDGVVVERVARQTRPVVAIDPAHPDTSGLLAAVAACRTQGITCETIARALAPQRRA